MSARRWMRVGLALGVLLGPALAEAQIRGGGRGGFRGGNFGGRPHVSAGFGPRAGHFRSFSGGFRGGFRQPGFRHGGFRFGGFRGGPRSAVFFGSPGFGFGPFVPGGFYAGFGYDYWPGYAYGYGAWPGYSYLSAPYYAPAYPVVVQREVIRYREREPYREEEARTPAAVSADRYWLLALRDNSIIAVTDYWLEDSTVHYITRQGSRSSVDLDRLDLSFTRQINLERGLEFRLPRPSAGPEARGRDAFGRPY
jgi:hypothetical protein